MKVPALVSPALRKPSVRGTAAPFPTYRYAIHARVLGQSCLRMVVEAWGRVRTCIWWPYSCEERSISDANCTEAADRTYLEANLAQVAQRPHKCRHGGVVCLLVRVGQS